MQLSEKYSFVKQNDYESVAGEDWPTFDQFQLHKNVEQFVYDEIDQMLKPDEVFDNPAFCVMPFMAGKLISNPHVAYCLQITTSKKSEQTC